VNLSHYLIGLLLSASHRLNFPDVKITLEIPPDSRLGDRSCSMAMSLAQELKRAPRQIAEEIRSALPQSDPFIEKIEIAGPGYLNFFWSNHALRTLLQHILRSGAEFGSTDYGAGEKHLIEFVSANPTGPLNIVSARAAAVGDCLVKLQRKIGYEVHSEFYVNDAGRQIELLGLSVRARLLEARGEPLQIPDGGYHGSYLKDYAAKALREFPGDPYTAPALDLGRWTARCIVADQRRSLLKYGVHFDRWFFESELHESDETMKALDLLQSAGYIYERDGATYFASSRFGDDEDRVVVTSDRRPTYFLPDIAYHLNKARRGYTRAYDLWGPDHHGHVLRMKAAMRAAGLPEAFLEVIIIQQVNLLRAGQPVKMSKRTGEMITMDELLEEVGADAAKQIFLSRRWSSHLDFDIEAAKDRSEKSPVFYLQYAHARICSIFRKTAPLENPGAADLKLLRDPLERELLRALSLFPDVIEAAALQSAPHRLNDYLKDLAAAFHKFYHECRVLSEDEAMTRARLALCKAVQITLQEGLRLLGMNAPERM
jgi:arginyl-tRNA synthetase